MLVPCRCDSVKSILRIYTRVTRYITTLTPYVTTLTRCHDSDMTCQDTDKTYHDSDTFTLRHWHDVIGHMGLHMVCSYGQMSILVLCLSRHWSFTITSASMSSKKQATLEEEQYMLLAAAAILREKRRIKEGTKEKDSVGETLVVT